ncbi:hypothetical protein Ocin01_09261 [Orchesella cincta]|uniref:DUF4789 domain-containing protein n=1 Tax=Orchesella cincta TaxID=48709 RepID=A0A1D2MWI6_ORCCI|nr:hypothetical protein Ocin01_09261 [Orchesella cincta]
MCPSAFKLRASTTTITLFLFLIPLCSAVPVDLYHSGYDEIKRAPPQKIDSPGLCPENLNNDNITNFRWFRYHNETKKCWHIDQRGPCGYNMIFYRIGETEYGGCECNFYYRCARPLLYWPMEKRCYFTNEQGPCEQQDWLVVTEDLKPKCMPNPCIYNQTVQPSRKDRYWFDHGGECFMTLTRGYCSHSDETLYTKWDEYTPSCHIGRECNLRKVRGTANSRSFPSQNSCLPGQKLDSDGRCRKIIRISWWSVLAK